MKKIILCGLLLSLIPVLGDDASTNVAPSAKAFSADTAAKAGAVDIRSGLVTIAKGGDPSPVTWDALDGRIDDFQKKFGSTPETTNYVVLLRKIQLAVAKKFPDPARYQALVKKLQTDPVPQVADMAKTMQANGDRLANLKTQPLDLKFTAMDGTAVDLSKLRGKVVLVDFWATSSPECREEVPNVVATYKKYHDLGFEIVGVSLDQSKDAVLAFTKENGMVWPEYFDGKGLKNEVSSSFDIHLIPTMWLIGKDGMVVNDDAGDHLGDQVDKLLKAP
jgi:peroxiredoxin